MVSVLVLSAVDHWWCNGERARLECCRSSLRARLGVIVSVLVLSAVDHWWCNGERARLECCRSLVV